MFPKFYQSLLCILEKAMAPHSSTLAWKLPWMEEPGRLQSMGSLRVGYDWATSLSLFTFMHWRRKWQPTPVLLPGESQWRGAWWAAVYGVAQSQTWLKWLRSYVFYILSSNFFNNILSSFSMSFCLPEFPLAVIQYLFSSKSHDSKKISVSFLT